MSLISNNNQKPLWKLAVKSLKNYRLRTGSIIFTIFACTFIMTLYPYLRTAAFMDTYKVFSSRQHVTFSSLDADTIDRLAQDPSFENLIQFRNGDIGTLENQYACPAYIKDLTSSKTDSFKLLKGHLPQQYNEILLDQELQKKLKASPGESLTFTSSGQEKETFQVCGIVKTSMLSTLPHFYVSAEYESSSPVFSRNSSTLQARLSSSLLTGDADTDIQQILDAASRYGIPEDRISVDYVSLDGNPFSSSLLYFYLFLDVIVLAIGILVIYSIFHISVVARIGEFAQMRTLGMNPSQIRRMVNREGTLLFLTGGTAGTAFGCLISFLLTGYWNTKHVGTICSLVLCVSYAFILLFLQKPARLASRMFPSHTAAYLDTPVSFHGKKIRLASLARLRIKKDRRSLFLPRLSFAMGGIAFLIASYYLAGADPEKMARTGLFSRADYIVSYISEYQDASETELLDFQKQDMMNDRLIQSLSRIPEIVSVVPFREENIRISMNGFMEYHTVHSLDRDDFMRIKPYLQDSSLTYEELEKSGGVIFNMTFSNPDTPKAGEMLHLNYYNGFQYQDLSLPVAALAESAFAEQNPDLNATILVPETLMEKMFPGINTTKFLEITVLDHKISSNVEREIQNILKDYPLLSVTSFSSQLEQIQKQSSLLSALLFSAALIVILFSIVSLLNSVLSRMVTQNRELALLEAIGMSQKEIRRMLVFECLYFSLPPLLGASVIGAAAGKLCISFLTYADPKALLFPLGYFSIYLCFAILAPVVLTLLCFRYFSKKTAVERLKASP